MIYNIHHKENPKEDNFMEEREVRSEKDLLEWIYELSDIKK